MNKFFAIAGGCVIAILVALFAVPAVVDWSRYRATFEDQASRLLGRPVRVGEQVRVQLLPSPYVSLENVRIADASGRFDTPLLRADSFHMQLAIGALLTGSLVAQDIEMSAPSLRLAIGADGRGNWVGIGTKSTNAGAGDFQGLALNAVHIEHGTLELTGAAGWHTRLTDISGDFDAPSLAGPYRFKGRVAKGGTPVDVHFSTGPAEAAGKTRLKVIWHDMAAGAANYALDGVVEGVNATPTFTGTVTAQVPKGAAGTGQVPLDFKASLEATPDRAGLSGIELVLDDGARPQRMMGTAVLDWRDGSASQASMSAVWLDLDRIAGLEPKAGPLATVRKLIDRLSAAAVAPDQARLQLTVGEAIVGGGIVNDLVLNAQNTGHGLRIDSLTGRLPGLSRLSMAGDIGTEGAGRFSGTMRLWGANVAALANWALPGATLPDKDNASPYLIDGTITAEPSRLRADGLRMEISGTTVTGSIAYAGNEPRSLTLALDSGRLDLAKLLDAPIAGTALSALLTPPANGGQASPDDPYSALRAMLTGDTHLDFHVGHLITAQGGLKDLSARLDRSNGRLDIPAIDLSTDAGVALHVEGALQSKGDTGLGQLRLTLAVPDVKALSEAAKLAGIKELSSGQNAAASALTPLKLAGTLQIGGAGSAGERLRMDGLANGSRATLIAERDGADSDWLSTRLDLAAELTNPDDGKLLSQVARALGATVGAPSSANAGRLSLRMSGIPDDAMITSAALDTQQLHSRFDGRTSIEAAGGIGFDGAFGIDAASGSSVVALARLDNLAPPIPDSVKLSAHAKGNFSLVNLTEMRGALGTNTLTGEARLDSTAQPAKLSANVEVAAVRLDQLFARLAPGQLTSGTTPVSRWSEHPLDFSSLAGIETKIDATAARLVLADGIAVADAKFTIISSGLGLDLALAQGRLAGGDVSGRAQLAKEAAGASLRLDATLTGLGFDGLASAATGLPLPHGKLDLNAHLEGHGLAISEIASAATGSGEFSISEGGIAGMSPLAINAVARDALADAGSTPNEAELKQRVDKARLLAPFPMLGAHGAVIIAEGAAKFDRLKVQSSKAELEIANRVDLATLRLSSTWTLSPKSPQPDAPALAPVQFVFEGPLTGFAAVPPVIDVAALERDLTSRKLLGGPEQMLGIRPETPPPEVPVAAVAPSSPAPQPSASATAATAPVPPPVAVAVNVAAPATIVGTPAALVATAAGSPTALDPATANSQITLSAPKPSQTAHARRKKANWAAALLQNLFGN